MMLWYMYVCWCDHMTVAQRVVKAAGALLGTVTVTVMPTTLLAEMMPTIPVWIKLRIP